MMTTTAKPQAETGVESYTDIHTHFLPGVDDGPADLRGTIDLLRAAYVEGTRTIVATPHMFHAQFGNRSVATMEKYFAETVAALDRLSGRSEYAFLKELDLCLGAENYVSREFFDALKRGEVLGLSGTRYLLIEFSHFFSMDFMQRAVYEVLSAQWIPVIAHVERCPQFHDRPEELDQILIGGAVAQVNAKSVAGVRGRKMQRYALKLFRQGRAHLLASDAHDAKVRTPELRAASEYLTKKLSAAVSQECVFSRPQTLVSYTIPALGS